MGFIAIKGRESTHTRIDIKAKSWYLHPHYISVLQILVQRVDTNLRIEFPLAESMSPRMTIHASGILLYEKLISDQITQ